MPVTKTNYNTIFTREERDGSPHTVDLLGIIVFWYDQQKKSQSSLLSKR